MIPQTAIIKLRLRLNKSHSSDYDNIPDWVAVEAIRKALLQILRRTIHGVNRTQEGDEETRIRIDDLQNLLVNKKLGGTNKKGYFESDTLPVNYAYYKNIEVVASKSNCSDKKMYSMLVEEANVQKYLNDWSLAPDYEWRQAFHTIAGNKIKIFTDDKFTVGDVILTYYRKPKAFDIYGYTHEDGTKSQNVDLEVKDDFAEQVIDEAATIIAGDIELPNQYSTNKTSTDTNV